MTEQKVLESTYHDHATVFRRTGVKDDVTKQTHKCETVVAKDIPCALSRNKSGSLTISDGIGHTSSSYTLFCSPGTEIQSGDRLLVTTEAGQQFVLWAGKPFSYGSHLELPLSEDERP